MGDAEEQEVLALTRRTIYYYLSLPDRQEES
jgi:hypothetical protein